MSWSIADQLRAERDTEFRPDIEGLRAIAVVAVLLYHGQIGPFDGGYVGVDVFFVLSGFLITRLLVRDLSKLGGRSLPNFWARRARRLLPASVLVIVTTLVVGWFVFDPLTHRSLAKDSIAAAAFVANFAFARRDGDYFAAELSPSPLLHFWSLAVEEQFYVVWPLIVLVAVRVRSGKRTALIGTIGVLWVASFAACVLVTSRNTPWAFYMLPTRAWELLSGAAVAVAAPAVIARWPEAVRGALAWVGLATVVSAVLLMSPANVFPGWIAVWPVAGTVAMVLGGIGLPANGPARWLGSAPLLWIGARSYGIYLWHWPVLLLAGASWGPLNAVERGALLVVSVAIAAFTYQGLENPVRYSRWLAVRPARGLLVGGALVTTAVAVAVVAFELPRDLDSGTLAETATLAPSAVPITSPDPEVVPVSVAPTSVAPVGPSTTIDDPVDLGDVVTEAIAANRSGLEQALLVTDVPSNLRPSLSGAASDKPLIYDNGCMLGDGASDPPVCIFGMAGSSTTVALFGDSHAAQWFPALHRIAEARGWRLETFTKQGCPTAEVPTTRTDRDPDCARWRDAVTNRLAADPPDLLVISSYRYNPGGLANEPWRSGLDATLSKLRPATDRLLILGDTPTPAPKDVPSCLAQNLRNARQCIATRSQGVVEARIDVERELARSHDASFAATGDWLCTEEACPVIFGDVLLYRDGNHISTEASLLLLPYLEATLVAALDNGSLTGT